jgi:5-methylcytosine-specific restriction endonuclease McrA
MPKEVLCTNCGSNYHYQTFCPFKKRKPITQQGKHAKLWQTFRDKVAIPYLDKKYGHICSYKGCSVTTNLDVDHIKGRGSHPGLRYDVKNMQYLCREHHRMKTDGKLRT